MINRVGDWVLIYFPQDETVEFYNCLDPGMGLYQIVSHSNPDISAKKLFFTEDPAIQVHQSRVPLIIPKISLSTVVLNSRDW